MLYAVCCTPYAVCEYVISRVSEAQRQKKSKRVRSLYSVKAPCTMTQLRYGTGHDVCAWFN